MVPSSPARLSLVGFGGRLLREAGGPPGAARSRRPCVTRLVPGLGAVLARRRPVRRSRLHRAPTVAGWFGDGLSDARSDPAWRWFRPASRDAGRAGRRFRLCARRLGRAGRGLRLRRLSASPLSGWGRLLRRTVGPPGGARSCRARAARVLAGRGFGPCARRRPGRRRRLIAPPTVAGWFGGWPLRYTLGASMGLVPTCLA